MISRRAEDGISQRLFRRDFGDSAKGDNARATETAAEVASRVQGEAAVVASDARSLVWSAARDAEEDRLDEDEAEDYHIDEEDLRSFAVGEEALGGDDEDGDDGFEGDVMELGGPESSDPTEGMLLCQFSRGVGADIAELEPVAEEVRRLKRLLGYHEYDMSLHFATDKEVQELNRITRGKDAPTDILSFPSPFVDFDAPEVPRPPSMPSMPKDIGDIVISVPYVLRSIELDRSNAASSPCLYDRDQGAERERGVSGAMAEMYTLGERLPLLAIHGVLHLLGHDHEADDEYELMVRREEEVLGQLQAVSGSDNH